MKRIMVMFLVVGFVIGAFAYSEGIDLASLSIDELVRLRNDLTDELFNRNGAVSLADGEYIVGKDIAAGSYTIVECEDNAWCRLIVFLDDNSESEMKKAEASYNEALRAYYDPENTEITEEPEDVDYSLYCKTNDLYDRMETRITLEDGNILDVSILKSGDGTNPLIIFQSSPLFMN